MTIACPHCGQPTSWRATGNDPRPVDVAMNTYVRLRTCACGKTAKTVELLASELAELRRCKYLLELQQARARAAAPVPLSP